MKKLTTITMLLVMATALVGSTSVHAETYQEARPFSSKRIISKVAERTGLTSLIDRASDAVVEAVTTENVGQDMYFRTYLTLREKIGERTSRRVAKELGVTTREVEDFQSGDLQAVIYHVEQNCKAENADNPDAACDVTKDEALNFIQNLQKYIASAHDDETVLVKVEEQVKATEIYANGSSVDSGFDLLLDLDIIEMILFNRVTQSYPRPTIGAERQIDLEKLLAGNNPEGVTPVEDQSPAPDSTPDPETDDEDGENESEETDEFSNARACFVDQTIEEAIEEHAKQKGNTETLTQGLRSEGRNIETGADAAVPRPIDLQHLGDDLIAAPAARRITEEFCANSDPEDKLKTEFCVEWNLKIRQATIFPAEDNCIACHVEHINDLFKETLSHSLVPSKITGNIYEPTTCKASFSLTTFDLNIFTMFSPILTPPNDDLLFKPSAFTSWRRLKTLYPFEFVDKLLPDDGPPQVQENFNAQRLLSFSRGNTPRTQIIESMQKLISLQAAELDQKIAQLEASEESEAQNASSQALTYEMRTMLQLFTSFQEMFEDTVANPCLELLQKPITR